jgi:LysR family glycine cleavage system transcriptional activator
VFIRVESVLRGYSLEKRFILYECLAVLHDRLPPSLDALRFFEAAARRLSIRLAAEELHVTPGAVSQQVRKLESFVGQSMFDRLPRGLALTSAGRDYFAACQDALSQIARATARLRSEGRQTVLVSCTPSFAAQWLIPRLQSFLDGAQGTDVHVSTTNRVVDLAGEGVHFAVRHGRGVYPGLKSEPLIDDDLVAVCSPRLVAPRRKAMLGDVERGTLLHDEHRGDWRLWLESVGLTPSLADRGVVFVDCNAAIEAALAGRGFALVSAALVETEVRTKQFLVVRAPALRSPLGYNLVYQSQTLADDTARGFRDWYVGQARSGV